MSETQRRTCKRKRVVQLAAVAAAVAPREAVSVAVLRRHPENVQSLLEHRMKHPKKGVHRAGATGHHADRARLATDLDDIA